MRQVKINVSVPVHTQLTARKLELREQLGREVTLSEVIEDLLRRAAGQVAA